MLTICVLFVLPIDLVVRLVFNLHADMSSIIDV